MAHLTTSLSNAEYRTVKAYSKSDLDMLMISTGTLEWSRNAKQIASEAIERGTDLHCALLEPERFAMDYVRAPDFDMRSSAGRANAEAFREANAHNGREILSAQDFDLLIAMRDSVLAHPTAKAYLTASGVSEASIFWEKDGIKLKCRPDRIPDHEHFGHMLVDVKKIADMDRLYSHIKNLRCYVQDAFYSDAYEQLTGHRPRFIFIFVGEKRSIGRHPVRILELDQEWKDKGRTAYLEDLEVAREIEEFGSGMDVEIFPMKREW